MAFQQCMFLGNIGKEIETRYAASGTAVCNFSVAVNEKYKDQETTTWFRCVAFGKTGELISQYLGKGSQIFVSNAKMQNRSYEQDGETKYITEYIVREFQFVGGGQQNQGRPQGGQPDNLSGDDVPF